MAQNQEWINLLPLRATSKCAECPTFLWSTIISDFDNLSPMVSWLLLFLKNIRTSPMVFCISAFSAIILGGTWSLLQQSQPTYRDRSNVSSAFIMHTSAAPLYFSASVSLHSGYSHFPLLSLFITTLWNSIHSSNIFPFS